MIKDDCWLWAKRKRPDGYGAFDRNQLAHRMVYEALVGIIPTGLQLDHLCRVRCCVNPQHLEPVTQAENIRRGKAGKVVKTHCKRGHALTPETTYQYSWGRTCKLCIKLRDSIRYAKLI